VAAAVAAAEDPSLCRQCRRMATAAAGAPAAGRRLERPTRWSSDDPDVAAWAGSRLRPRAPMRHPHCALPHRCSSRQRQAPCARPCHCPWVAPSGGLRLWALPCRRRARALRAAAKARRLPSALARGTRRLALRAVGGRSLWTTPPKALRTRWRRRSPTTGCVDLGGAHCGLRACCGGCCARATAHAGCCAQPQRPRRRRRLASSCASGGSRHRGAGCFDGWAVCGAGCGCGCGCGHCCCDCGCGCRHWTPQPSRLLCGGSSLGDARR